MPSWMFTMAACCLAAMIVGWIIAWVVDEWGDWE